MKSTLFLALAASAWLGSWFLQQPDTRPKTGTVEDKTQPLARPTDRGDDLFASWLIVGGNNEIALAELAQRKAQDPEVKRFAEMMIKDHREMGTQLQAFASPGGMARHEPAGSAGMDKPGDKPGDMPGNKPGDTRNPGDRPLPEASGVREASATPGNVHMVALVEELGAQCLDSSRNALEQKQGADFDRCYMGMAVGAHRATKDMLTVFQRHASPELAKLLADAQRTVGTHLEQAERLQKQLDENRGASTARAISPSDGQNRDKDEHQN